MAHDNGIVGFGDLEKVGNKMAWRRGCMMAVATKLCRGTEQRERSGKFEKLVHQRMGGLI
jgi:hypothetical protein